MKKTKIIIQAIAVTMAISAAIASKPHQACTGEPQFYFDGTNYHAAGVLGRDYYCATGTGTCTYIGSGNFYQACQTGVYTPFHAKASKR